MSFLEFRKEQSTWAKSEEIAARYYLLNGDFAVISAKTGEENSQIGCSFFDVFPANRVLREEIAEYVHSYPQKTFLTLCTRTPILFVGTLFAQTGLILAIVPEGAVRKTLTFPAAFHHVPACVCISPSAKMRHKSHDEAAFGDACRWILAASAPFLIPQGASQSLSEILRARAASLGALLNVTFSFDASGLVARSCDSVDVAFALGVMLAALFAAHHFAGDAVQAYAAIEGAPTLYLAFSRRTTVDDPAEFFPLLRVAAARGAVLDVVCPNEHPERLQVRACIGTVELSAQGVRERDRFLEGKSPFACLPSAIVISPPFLELSFD